MEKEDIKLGECACCHNIRKVHRVDISYLRFAFICDECDSLPQNAIAEITDSLVETKTIFIKRRKI